MDKKELLEKLREEKFSGKIIQAFEKVRREEFVPKGGEKYAYRDIPLYIGYGATISQPYTIAFMLDLLKVKDKQKILEIGSGSGYVLALLSELSPDGKIFGIERIKELADSSKEKLKKYKNIEVIHGNGFKGLEKEALFDRILVSASAEEIPYNLINQLKEKGILVTPVRSSILRIVKEKKENKIEEYPGFAFVPLIDE